MPAPPTRPLTASELLEHPEVVQGLVEAWADSKANDPTNRHEEGGWIYLELSTGVIVLQRAPTGTRSRLSLANPPLLPNHVIVGTYHTHPNPASEGWLTEPSSQDERAANFSGVPWLSSAEDGDYSTGPDSRRGGLAGGPGLPAMTTSTGDGSMATKSPARPTLAVAEVLRIAGGMLKQFTTT